MPPRSSVSQLPAEIRAELERRLIQNGFSGYQDLEDWLRSLGFEISRSSLHRHGQKFEERVQALKLATEQAKAIVTAAPDEEGAVSDALMRLVQEKLFQVLLDFQLDPKKPINIANAAKAVAQLSRATVTQRKWQAEVRERAQEAAEAAAKIAKKGGLSGDAVDEIRRRILGIAT